ncbi:YsnF/AvaK domain-containing protein [Actinocorallia sp. B10E7]|uniref:YsnF/AvaK domain-containing protein n=1 Tax=Actinocorallia sp. B10E7 TaxID=3153558 RepID=UPI00325CFC98
MDIKKLLGARMTGPDGEELGTIEQIFFDDVTGAQEWARLRMGGLLGGKDRFVPLVGSSLSGKDLTVPYDKNKVKDSPELSVERHITPEQESRLRSYYELDAGAQTRTTTTPPSGTGKTAAAASAAAAGVAGERTRAEAPETTGPAGTTTGAPGTATGAAGTTTGAPGAAGAAGVTSGAAGAAGLGRERTAEAGRAGQPGELALTRCEERIAFHTEEIEVGRVRLHKYVDVVPVEERVRLVHEEFELERIPVTEGAADIREDSLEVVLRGQEAFAVKEIHPVERVRLNVKQVPEERVIHDEIRKERIEVERMEGAPRTPGAGPSGRTESRGAESSVDRSDEPPGRGRRR